MIYDIVNYLLANNTYHGTNDQNSFRNNEIQRDNKKEK